MPHVHRPFHRQRRSPLCGLLAALLLAPAAFANGNSPAPSETVADAHACARDAARRVQRHYDAIRDWSARFEQTTKSVVLGGGALGSEKPVVGDVVFQKPGKMRWTYESPASVVVSDGATLWIYDPTAREAQKMSVAAGGLSGAALHLSLIHISEPTRRRLESRLAWEGC